MPLSQYLRSLANDFRAKANLNDVTDVLAARSREKREVNMLTRGAFGLKTERERKESADLRELSSGLALAADMARKPFNPGWPDWKVGDSWVFNLGLPGEETFVADQDPDEFHVFAGNQGNVIAVDLFFRKIWDYVEDDELAIFNRRWTVVPNPLFTSVTFIQS